MNIKFQQIQLHNFASYSDSVLDLSDMGITLVSGRNNCKLDNAYSNGSGKSAVFNGICFALTGETSQGVSTGLENIFTDPNDCWVKLTFTVDNDNFVIQRIKTPKQNLKVYINGEDKSGKGIRESSQLIATYLPDLTSELVSSIIILGQGLPHRFTNNKPSHRKELLENLTKSDFMIDSIKSTLEERLTKLRLEVRSLEDNKISSESKLGVYESQLEGYKAELSVYNEYSDGIETEIYNNDKLISSIEESLQKIAEDLEEVNKSISDCDSKINKYISEKSNKVQEATSELQVILTEKTNKSYELKAEIKSLNKEIMKLESITDICPTCGQKIPDVNKPSTDEHHKEITKLNNELTYLVDEISQVNVQIEKIKKEINEEYNERVNKLSLTKQDLTTEKNTLAQQKVKLEGNKKTLVDKQYKLRNMKDNYNKVVSNINTAENEIKQLTDSMSQITVDMTNVNSHIEVVQQMVTLAKREFRGILLLNIINLIDSRIKKYSKEVFGTDKLSFTLNDNYIDITYCDKMYENLSGGEKQKIDIIIQLALRDILSRQLNIHSNLLVLDEIYDNADAISCQKITNLISTLTDIDSIFIISHHVQDLGITYDNNLMVEKDEQGISSLSFV